jgi:hypothetical protein
MGNCVVGESPYHILRCSLPGALLSSENDFREFYQLCHTETHTIGSQLPITSTQCFFVVVSGEVLVTMSIKDGKQITLATVLPGDLIMFFGVNIEAVIINGYLDFDGIKIGLHFRSTDALAKVIGSDYISMKLFLDSKIQSIAPNMKSFKALFELKLEKFLSMPAFLTLTKNQVSQSLSLCVFISFSICSNQSMFRFIN